MKAKVPTVHKNHNVALKSKGETAIKTSITRGERRWATGTAENQRRTKHTLPAHCVSLVCVSDGAEGRNKERRDEPGHRPRVRDHKAILRHESLSGEHGRESSNWRRGQEPHHKEPGKTKEEVWAFLRAKERCRTASNWGMVLSDLCFRKAMLAALIRTVWRGPRMEAGRPTGYCSNPEERQR